MGLQPSSAAGSSPKPSSFEGSAAALPIEGIEALARIWAGSGSLLDWIAPQDWDLELAWTPAEVRARVTELVLLRFARQYLPFLPRHAGEWIDLISQQLNRHVGRTPTPTAHTDWSATLSEFGRYPSEMYVERRPVATYDTPHTRVLKWMGRAVRRAERLVQSQFGRSPLSSAERAVLFCPLELLAVASAADEVKPSDFDVEVCKASGGAWLLVARLTEALSAVSFGSAIKQFHSLSPALPELDFQLFEIGTLGAAVNELRARFRSGQWTTRHPLAAARSNQPCLGWNAEGVEARIFFQTPARPALAGVAPYRSLAGKIGGRSLRPDIWIEIDGPEEVEFILECKFSLDPSYVAGAITQLVAYDFEFPATDRRRILVAVGPKEVVRRPWAWRDSILLCSPGDAAELVAAAAGTGLNDLLETWRVA